MNWVYSLVKVVGVSFPGIASLVQAQAEYDSAKIKERLDRLEDPIGQLHPKMGKLCEALFTQLQTAGSSHIELAGPAYEEFARPLALLEGRGLIEGSHVLGRAGLFKHGMRVESGLTLYLCARFEREQRMQQLFELVDNCGRGESLRAQDIMKATQLSNAVVYAMFKSYEEKGLGLVSKEIGLNQAYYGQA